MGGAISSGAKVITSGFAQGMGMSNAPKYEVKEIKTTSPTTAEVDQATTTDATGIKRRRRGRSPTILTGSTGVQEGATLGTPTLLG
jgi:hypothetical protein